MKKAAALTALAVLLTTVLALGAGDGAGAVNPLMKAVLRVR